MRRRSPLWAGKFRAMVLALTMAAAAGPQAQSGLPANLASRQIDDNLRALQRESEQLATEADSLVDELRRLETLRNRRGGEARDAEAAAAAARQALEASRERVAALEAQRRERLPDLRAQLVDLYKYGRGRHARLLLRAGSVREFARARRAAAALVTISQHRLAEHQRLLATLEAEHAAVERTAAELEARETAARQARADAQRALDAHRALVARIESQRELNARYVAELEAVYRRLLEDIGARESAAAAPATAAPADRTRLQWPAAGPVTGRYGDTAGRLGGSAVRNGIEIAAVEGAPVQAADAGTVSFAGPYTGFGTLAVLDHGGNRYSLYGYLGSVHVAAGDRVERGAELGRVGLSPAGPPALYFELRVDGQPVDPVQWLVPR